MKISKLYKTLKCSLILAFLIYATLSQAQSTGVSINTAKTPADPSAMLDVSATNLGVLIPRVALTDTADSAPVSSPAISLLVYNTANTGNVTPGYYFWDGGEWERLVQTLKESLAQGNDANALQIKNLADPTATQDAATKAYVDAIKASIYDELLDAGLNGTVKDIEGNTYKTIKIGNQVWMAENLYTTKYNDDTDIPLVTGTSVPSTPAYFWFGDNEATYKNTYGALYNWYAVNTGKLCPTGWHVPSDAEWTTLTDYLGGAGVAGGKLKETGTTHWTSPNTGATNETGFTALPGGYRDNDGSFNYIGSYGGWWSSSAHNYTHALGSSMSNSYSGVNSFGYGKVCGFSVRCVRD